MVKGLLMLGVGAAAVGLARFCSTAIREERQRRNGLHESHETTRWEGEGGNPVMPQSALGQTGGSI